MKQIMRSFVFAALMLVIGVCVSCSKDDDATGIVGSWLCVKGEPASDEVMLTFQSGGSVTLTLGTKKGYSKTMSYSLDGKKLTITTSSGTKGKYTAAISGKNMVLTANADTENDDFEGTYKKQ